MLEGHFCKEVVLPFQKFREEPPTLGPEMRSTGEVMGMDTDFGMAYAKAQIAGGNGLPTAGTAFLSVHDRDKQNLVPIARELREMGFALIATRGTAAALQAAGLEVRPVFKVHEGRPHCVDKIINGEIDLVVETPLAGISYGDEHALRAAAIAHGVPMVTTLSAARAATKAIAALKRGDMVVQSLQEHWHRRNKTVEREAS